MRRNRGMPAAREGPGVTWPALPACYPRSCFPQTFFSFVCLAVPCLHGLAPSRRRSTERRYDAMSAGGVRIARSPDLVQGGVTSIPSTACGPRDKCSASTNVVSHEARDCLLQKPSRAWHGRHRGGVFRSCSHVPKGTTVRRSAKRCVKSAVRLGRAPPSSSLTSSSPSPIAHRHAPWKDDMRRSDAITNRRYFPMTLEAARRVQPGLTADSDGLPSTASPESQQPRQAPPRYSVWP